MKRVASIFFLLMPFSTLLAQDNLKDFDSLLSKTLQTHIGFPECNACDSSGLALLIITEFNDSLIIKTLYASSFHFDQEKDDGFIRRFNKAYKKNFKKNSSVVIPLHFNYYKEGDILVPINTACEKALTVKLKSLKKGTHILNPVLIKGFELVH